MNQPSTNMAESNLSAAVGAPSDRVAYLQSLRSVRERCSQVYALAEQNKLDYWDVDLSKQAEIVDFCCQLIAVRAEQLLSLNARLMLWVSVSQRDYGDNYASIPPHGRLRHIGGMDRLQPYLDAWRDNVSPIEITRRLIDFCVVSVLLDAGAGPKWTYKVKGSDFAVRTPLYSYLSAMLTSHLTDWPLRRSSTRITRHGLVRDV